MQKLRSIHLYLGCLFAPMLLFFAISGILQTCALAPAYQQSKALAWLSTIHTSHGLKVGTLSSPNSSGLCARHGREFCSYDHFRHRDGIEVWQEPASRSLLPCRWRNNQEAK